MILLKPEKGIADQEITDLITAEVENESAPLLVFALAGVGMLVMVRSIGQSERMPVPGEVGGIRNEDDTNTGLMQLVYKIAEVVRRDEATGCGKVTCNLI